MPKIKETDRRIKLLIVEAKHAGRTDCDVAGQFHVDHRTVARIYNRWVAQNTVEKRSRSRRPQKITICQERSVVRHVKADSKRSAVDLKKKASERIWA